MASEKRYGSRMNRPGCSGEGEGMKSRFEAQAGQWLGQILS